MQILRKGYTRACRRTAYCLTVSEINKHLTSEIHPELQGLQQLSFTRFPILVGSNKLSALLLGHAWNSSQHITHSLQPEVNTYRDPYVPCPHDQGAVISSGKRKEGLN